MNKEMSEVYERLMKSVPRVDFSGLSNLHSTYDVYEIKFDDDYLVELIHKYARTKKAKHIKAFINYINYFEDELNIDPYDSVLITYHSYLLSKLINRKRGRI